MGGYSWIGSLKASVFASEKSLLEVLHTACVSEVNKLQSASFVHCAMSSSTLRSLFWSVSESKDWELLPWDSRDILTGKTRDLQI